jgi:hypothetical protein
VSGSIRTPASNVTAPASCDPPRGTTTYVNKHGYPCGRTGLVSVCKVWAKLIFIGLPANYSEALVIESLTHASRCAAFAIPGTHDAQEGGVVPICGIFWVPASVAVAMSLIRRVPDVVFGVPSVFGWQLLKGGFVGRHAVEEPWGS